MDKDKASNFTVEIFVELGKFREKCPTLNWEKNLFLGQQIPVVKHFIH